MQGAQEVSNIEIREISNLFHHLKHQHPSLYQECLKAKEESSAANATKLKQSELVHHGIAESRQLYPFDKKEKQTQERCHHLFGERHDANPNAGKGKTSCSL